MWNLSQRGGSTVKYRRLGRTGLQVSELGFGTGSMGGLMVRGGHREILAAVARSIELGVNYFDTARDYGDGRSEANLGAALRELGADVYIGTKVRLSASEMENIEKGVQESVQGSLRCLKRDYVDLIQLHNPIGMQRQPERGYVGVDDVGTAIDAFEALQRKGHVGHWGTTGLGETEALQQAVDLYGGHTLQACYNLLNPSAFYKVPDEFPFQDYGQLIDRVSGRDVGVIAIRVMAGGALSGASYRHPHVDTNLPPIGTGASYAEDVDLARKFNFLLGQGYADDMAEVAIRFVISNPFVSTALVGFSSLEQLNRAAEAVAKGPLPKEALEQITEETWKLHTTGR
jgi:aryl-alcohol dehydrogenase-like predicted oxidoreductase